MSDEELQVESERLRRQQFDLRALAVTEKVDNPRQFRNLRRDLARVLTEQNLRRKRREAEAAPTAPAGAGKE